VTADEPHPQAIAASSEPLLARADVVARADALAAAGSKESGASGARQLLAAAELRERAFRIDHREVDALEAVELYRQTAVREPHSKCSASLAQALLEGEVHADPAATFQAVYRAQKAPAAEKACEQRAAAVLATLAAYRPAPAVLAELDAQAHADAEPRPNPAASSAANAPVAASALLPEPAANDGVIVPTVAPGSTGAPRVTKIERYGAPDAARVVIFLSQPATYQVGFLDEATAHPRLFVDIAGAAYHGVKSFDVGGLVERVRIGAEPSRTRVVLDLATNAHRRVFYVPEPFRLIIDVSKEAPAHVEEAARGPRAVHRVVLDPGHGGYDPGASGPSGLREKDVTLDIAHRAAPLIARELGISTLLTRDSDDYVALDERTARANAFQADLFVSIHCNASEDGAGRGVMTFVLDDSRDASATRVAARENESSAAAAAELANALSHGEGLGRGRSTHFAELLQRSAIASLAPSYGDIPDSGIKRAGFYVLAGARMPAVLFETSFISNPVGETRFNSGDFRQKIADAIVNAIRAYRDGL